MCQQFRIVLDDGNIFYFDSVSEPEVELDDISMGDVEEAAE